MWPALCVVFGVRERGRSQVENNEKPGENVLPTHGQENPTGHSVMLTEKSGALMSNKSNMGGLGGPQPKVLEEFGR